MSRFIFAVIASSAFTFAVASANAGELVVHEWGTFTSFQDESGNSIGGINVDDEPVPSFVHTLRWDLIGPGNPLTARRGPALTQGVPRLHPDVTMRLETPVMYFHRPKDAPPTTVDVSVGFRGGWLSQFYPAATASIDGREASERGFEVGRIKSDTQSALNWPGLRVGTEGQGPKTTEHVWLAPRQVASAATVTSSRDPSESEKYLFYRGVAHLDAPLKVSRDGEMLHVERSAGAQAGEPNPEQMWLVDIRRDGKCAFRAVQWPRGDGFGRALAVAKTRAEFASDEYRPDTAELRRTMHQALVSERLFADEAEAMLNTWELSYFKSPGTRLFFIVPRQWTERVLPLTVTWEGKPVPQERIVRAMIGRVELLTPEHERLLKAMTHRPAQVPTQDWLDIQFKAYQDLGRFRDAIVLREFARQPEGGLKKFIADQDIGSFDVR